MVRYYKNKWACWSGRGGGARLVSFLGVRGVYIALNDCFIMHLLFNGFLFEKGE